MFALHTLQGEIIFWYDAHLNAVYVYTWEKKGHGAGEKGMVPLHAKSPWGEHYVIPKRNDYSWQIFFTTFLILCLLSCASSPNQNVF